MSEGIQINARAPAPADLIRAIGRALDPIAAGLGLDVVLSDNAFDALDALADAPGGGRVVVAWRGDDNRAGLPGGHGGGVLGYLVGPASVKWLGYTGSALLSIVLVVLGVSLVCRLWITL